MQPNLRKKRSKDNGIFRVHLMAIEEECFIVKAVKSNPFVCFQGYFVKLIVADAVEVINEKDQAEWEL